jgi:hypothetical protein
MVDIFGADVFLEPARWALPGKVRGLGVETLNVPKTDRL